MEPVVPEPTRIGETLFDWGSKTYVMGVINVTPDSFSGDGIGSDVDSAIRLAKSFQDWGADVVDVGGESTRPSSIYAGAAPASEEVELGRVLPVVEALEAEIDIPVSIDTYKASVAERAIAAGADMINDVWGFSRDPDMARVAADAGVPVVLMHNQDHTHYDDLVPDVISRLRWLMDQAVDAGVAIEKIVLDPGMGFGKTAEHNLEISAQAGRAAGARQAAARRDVAQVDYRVRARPAGGGPAGGHRRDRGPVDRQRGRHRAGARRQGDGPRRADVRRGGSRVEPGLMLSEAYVGLGSNLGDRAANIRLGLEAMRRVSQHVQAVQSVRDARGRIPGAAALYQRRLPDVDPAHRRSSFWQKRGGRRSRERLEVVSQRAAGPGHRHPDLRRGRAGRARAHDPAPSDDGEGVRAPPAGGDCSGAGASGDRGDGGRRRLEGWITLTPALSHRGSRLRLLGGRERGYGYT